MSGPKQKKNSLSSQALDWAHIVEISDQLLQLAEQQNWQQLGRLQLERDQLIDLFFRSETRTELVPVIQEDIRNICDQDQKIVQMVTDNRDQLGAEAKHLQAMKHRIQQYLSTENS